MIARLHLRRLSLKRDRKSSLIRLLISLAGSKRTFNCKCTLIGAAQLNASTVSRRESYRGILYCTDKFARISANTIVKRNTGMWNANVKEEKEGSTGEGEMKNYKRALPTIFSTPSRAPFFQIRFATLTGYRKRNSSKCPG